jgi:hypothetical protein
MRGKLLVNTHLGGQFPPDYNMSVLVESSTPYQKVGEYKGSNGCHYRGLPLSIHGIQGK